MMAVRPILPTVATLALPEARATSRATWYGLRRKNRNCRITVPRRVWLAGTSMDGGSPMSLPKSRCDSGGTHSSAWMPATPRPMRRFILAKQAHPCASLPYTIPAVGIPAPTMARKNITRFDWARPARPKGPASPLEATMATRGYVKLWEAA